MPTLLQINVTSNWGSTGKIVEQIGRIAQDRGWESYVAYGRYANPSKLKTIKIGNMFDVYEHYFENRFLDREGLASRNATKKLIRVIEDINPDIIHLHNIHDHYLNYRILFDYLNSTNIQVVWTLHDCWNFTGHCAFIPTQCKRWEKGCYHCPVKNVLSMDRSSANYILKKNLFSSIQSLIFVPVSEWLKGFMERSFLKDANIFVIKNGIDLSSFKPQHVELPKQLGMGEKIHILGVAQVWDSRKGLDDFIALREMLPSTKYSITLVGLNKKQIKLLPKGIVGIERTNNVGELAKLYTEADVFINPTYQDNYPTTNLEALACGTPVITYRTGGSPEAVDEYTGLVVEQGDKNALAEAIIKITSKTMEERAKTSRLCRERAEKYFDKNKCFEAYIDLYNKIVKDLKDK